MNPQELYDYNIGKIGTLDPRVQESAKSCMGSAWKRAWYFKIIYARRTLKQQKALYAQGRTTPGNIVTNTIYGSKHLQGLAIDVLLIGGQSYEDLEALWLPFGVTRPLAMSPLGDKGHYEFAIPSDLAEPYISVAPIERLKALVARLSRTVSPSARSVLQNVVDRLEMRLRK